MKQTAILVVLVAILLTGCGSGDSTSTVSSSPTASTASITTWAEAIQRGDMETADAMTLNPNNIDWYEHIRSLLSHGSFSDARIIQIHQEEITSLNRSATRVQWKMVWQENKKTEYRCVDVKVINGKVDPAEWPLTCSETGYRKTPVPPTITPLPNCGRMKQKVINKIIKLYKEPGLKSEIIRNVDGEIQLLCDSPVQTDGITWVKINLTRYDNTNGWVNQDEIVPLEAKAPTPTKTP